MHEIDLLRFCAAMAVVFFHYAFRGYAADGLSKMPYPLLAPVAKYGYLGVELFFMISGFVILMTAEQGSLKRFAMSRVARLYPAFWACCTITFVVTLWLGRPGQVSLSQYLVNMTLLSEFVGVDDIDGVYWSLFVEIRFYLGVALLLLFRQMANAQRWLAVWLVASTVARLVHLPWLRVWLIVDYAPLFVAGATFYRVWQSGWSRERALLLGLAWVLALYAALGEAGGIARYYGEAFDRSVVAGLISLFFGAMALVASRRTGFIGRRRWTVVGALTYPLYLIHQNIGYMVFNSAFPAVNPHLLLWGTIALMLGAAYVVHVRVERPLGRALRPRYKSSPATV